ncbi:MAG: CoA-binding protein [Burkholderiales bacterium]|nr:CoA-binding protein [Burkholderiales bacterium]
MFSNPDIGEICSLLRDVKTIAMVGLSPLQKRPSYRIARGLQGLGYKIVPVRPLITEILGEKTYSKLSEVPDPVDLVLVFRPARFLDAIVDECVIRNFKRLWIQEGIINQAAAEHARNKGIKVIMDRCIWRDRNGPCEPLLAKNL